MLSLTQVLVGLVAFALVAYFFNNNKKGYDLPPGPWGLPIFGHLLFFGRNPARKFLEWKQIYGPIMTVRFGSFHAVVLNDAKLIKEAFSMSEFSGRPLIPILSEMSNKKGDEIPQIQVVQRQNGISSAEGPKQVEQKKFALKAMREFGAGSRSLEHRIYEETFKLFISLNAKIRELNGQPLKMNKLFQFAVINSFWVSIMGERFEENDPNFAHLIHCFDRANDTNSTIIAQLFWFFPWVAKLGNAVGYNPPLHGFHNVYKFMEKEINRLKQVYVKGQSKYYSDAYFNKVDQTTDPKSSFHESDNQQPFSTGDLFIGAIDTSVITLDWFMIYMARQPKLQAQLQDEIDSVMGLDKSRMPSLADRPNMPYTNAVIEELLRVTSLVPFGFFHGTMQDVEFKGYKIPKNTMVISNLYAVHRDPDVWQNPDEFDPSRFLDENGKFRKNETNETIPFSSGKRVCLGEGLARDQLFLLATNFFREFAVSCTENIPSLEPKFGVVVTPIPFELNVKVR